MNRTKRRKCLSLFLAASLVLASLAGAGPLLAQDAFPDVSGHWAGEEIAQAVSRGFVQGYDDGSFRPGAPVTRAEFVTMVNQALGLREDNTVRLLFEDVPEGVWYHKEVAKASYARYVTGITDTEFRPGASITRQEAATMLSRVLPKAGTRDQEVLAAFPDAAAIGSWAAEGVSVLVNKGYMKGRPTGDLAPRGLLTRAEAVTLINQILDNETIVREDVSVETSGEILQDAIYVGDITIEKSVGDGDVSMENITALSAVYVLGGGVETVLLIDSYVVRLYVLKDGDPVRVQSDGSTVLFAMVFNNNSLVDGNNDPAQSEEGGYGIVIEIDGEVDEETARALVAAIEQWLNSGGQITDDETGEGAGTVVDGSDASTDPDKKVIVVVVPTPDPPPDPPPTGTTRPRPPAIQVADGEILNRTTMVRYNDKSIQEVIDLASAGDEIWVGNGEWEPFVIETIPEPELNGVAPEALLEPVDRDGITVRSFNRHGAVIGSEPGEVELDRIPAEPPAVIIRADDITIDGMKIINAREYGILIDMEHAPRENTRIQNNYIEGADHGISFGVCNESSHAGSAVISGNTILDSGTNAIRYHAHGREAGHAVSILNNTIEGSGDMGIRVWAACAGGVMVRVLLEPPGPEIKSVRIAGNTISGTEGEGIRVQATKNSRIQSITVEDNTISEHECQAIRIHAAGDSNGSDGSEIGTVLVRNNTILGKERVPNGGGGAASLAVSPEGCGGGDGPGNGGNCSDGDDLEILGVDGESGVGVRVQIGPNSVVDSVTVTGNTITNSGQGIRVHGGRYNSEAGSVTIGSNQISDSDCHGIWVKLHGLEPVESRAADVLTGTPVAIRDNTVTRSGKRGISVWAASGVVYSTLHIEDNTVAQSYFEGDGCECGAEGIRIHLGGSGGSADRRTRIEELFLRGNTVSQGEGGGIRIHSGRNSVLDHAVISGNTIADNEGTGLRIGACHYDSGSNVPGIVGGADITGNTITGNETGVSIHTGRVCRYISNRYGGEIHDITLTGNTIGDSRVAGIFLGAERDGSIDGVLVDGNTLTGNYYPLAVFEDAGSGGSIDDLTSDVVPVEVVPVVFRVPSSGVLYNTLVQVYADADRTIPVGSPFLVRRYSGAYYINTRYFGSDRYWYTATKDGYLPTLDDFETAVPLAIDLVMVPDGPV